ncbi:MAG: S41 family peptidase [Chloroflexota bacterium]|nr:S41 family peptidase [Chloroflexota bacterium]
MSSELDLDIDETTRAEVIDGVVSRLRGRYVFPQVGERMETHVRARVAAGDYNGIVTAKALSEQLTDDIREISNDGHLRVRYSVEPRPLYTEEHIGDNPERAEEYLQEARQANYGYRKVERLAGNVGYIEQVGLHDVTKAAPMAMAAFNLIADTDALIIDLRANGGGDPRHVALICSYLLPEEPVHLNSFYSREDEGIQQFWSWAWLPGRRYLDTPVWVLTSERTYSGAEELSYNLKTLGRATLVGETTGGGANPVNLYQINAHFEISIPFARAVNPITGGNWEGTGVTPDVPVPADDALTTAYALALHAVLDRLDGYMPRPRAALAGEVREALNDLDGNRP